MESSIETPDGAALRYCLKGRGEPVVAISGLGGTAAFWDPVTVALSRRFKVLSFDQRGIGASRHGQEPTSLAILADDVLRLADSAFPGRPVRLVGHSTGGVIAQLIAHRRPSRVRAIVLSGTWIEADAYMREVFDLRLRVLQSCPTLYGRLARLLAHRPEPSNEAFWRGNDGAGAPATVADKETHRARIEALLSYSGSLIAPSIHAPCLVFGARDDMVVPYYHQQRLAQSLPNAKLRHVASGGHFFPVTRHQRYSAVVGDWLDEH